MLCDTCGTPMVSGNSGGPVWACLQCGATTPRMKSAAPRPAALKLPHMDRGRQEVLTDELEKKVVGRIVAMLGRNHHPVIQVGQKYARHSGTSKGCPDVFIGIEGFTVWNGTEIKRPGWTQSDVTPEQWELYQRGCIDIISSVEEARIIAERMNRIREFLRAESL